MKSRIAIGVNLSAMLYDLHQAGYVVGDFNDQNIGIKYATGQVYMMDCDSFHITKENGEVLRTNAIMPGFLAPEIIKHCAEERADGHVYNLDNVALPTFTRESDLFCLALHIFKLIMNGIDPFRGVNIMVSGSAASPFTGNEAIERGAYVFKPGNRPSAVFCPALGCLPPSILGLFNRAFLDSRQNPKLRPTTTEWYQSLVVFLDELKQCEKNTKHYYHQALSVCPYCKADEQYSKEFLGSTLNNTSALTKDFTGKRAVEIPMSATFVSKPTIVSLKQATVIPEPVTKPTGFISPTTASPAAKTTTSSLQSQPSAVYTPKPTAPMSTLLAPLKTPAAMTKTTSESGRTVESEPVAKRHAPGGHRLQRVSIARNTALDRYSKKHTELRQIVDRGSFFAVDFENATEAETAEILHKVNKDVYDLTNESNHLVSQVLLDDVLTNLEQSHYKRLFDKISEDAEKQLNFYFIKIFCDFIGKDYISAKVFASAAIQEFPKNVVFAEMYKRASILINDG